MTETNDLAGTFVLNSITQKQASAVFLAFHDVDDFRLFLDALDMSIAEVLDEGNSSFSTADSAVFDTAFMECTERLTR